MFFFKDCLQVKFHDHEEKVRLEAVISVCEAAAERLDVIPKKVTLICYFSSRSLATSSKSLDSDNGLD